MEFEEVRNFVEMGHVEGASLSTTSLQWRHPVLGEPLIDPYSRRRLSTSKRPNPILGVSRLVNSVRRLKRKDSGVTTAEMYRRAANSSQEYTAHAKIPDEALSRTTHEVSCDLHEIKCQMQNFVVPTDWYTFRVQAPCFDHESIDTINAPALVANIKEDIARLEYLIRLEEQRIESSKTDTIEFMDKLKALDAKVERINTNITLGRLDAIPSMKVQLKKANIQVPELQELCGQHKRVTTVIEGYCKGMNIGDRLEILQAQARTTTRSEAAWARFRHWGPFITIVILSMFIALVAFWHQNG